MGEIHITLNPDPAGPALRIQLDEAPPTPAVVHYADHVRLTLAGAVKLILDDPETPAPQQSPTNAGRSQLAALLELLDYLPDPAPCHKCRYCQASAAYGNEATTRGCQEFALRAAFPPAVPAPPTTPAAAAPPPEQTE